MLRDMHRPRSRIRSTKYSWETEPRKSGGLPSGPPGFKLGKEFSAHDFQKAKVFPPSVWRLLKTLAPNSNMPTKKLGHTLFKPFCETNEI